MHPVQRAIHEHKSLFRILSAPEMLRILAGVALHFPAILRSKKLTSVDKFMSKDITFYYRGAHLSLPIRRIDDQLVEFNDNPTFGNFREMFANDVYLRRFPNLSSAATVVDLGSNRGLFLVIAKSVLHAETAIGVEPCKFYDKSFSLLCECNAIEQNSVTRLAALIGPCLNEGIITMDDLIARHNVRRIDFLKCDIEGAEYALFDNGDSWLPIVKNLAMELHPTFRLGVVEMITSRLSHHGFSWVTTDQFDRVAVPEKAEFLYASSVGGLV